MVRRDKNQSFWIRRTFMVLDSRWRKPTTSSCQANSQARWSIYYDLGLYYISRSGIYVQDQRYNGSAHLQAYPRGLLASNDQMVQNGCKTNYFPTRLRFK